MEIAPLEILEVYLDSSDFSTLSNPKTLTPEFSKVLDQLKKFRDEGKVNFRFSNVHVTEVAPVVATENLAAEMRAELMLELCGSKVMIDYTRLLESEVKAEPIDAFSNSGQWYPSIDGLLPENIGLLHKKMADEALNEQGLNREQRRLRKKTILNKRGLKPKFVELINSSNTERANSLAKTFPLTDSEARVTINFLQTGKNREQAEAAFLRVLTDPRWLIKKIAGSPADIETLSGWLRVGGKVLAETVTKSTAEMQRLRLEEIHHENELKSIIIDFTDTDLKNNLLNKQSSRIQKAANSRSKFWQDIFLRTVNNCAESIGRESNIKHAVAITREEAFLRFPGVSTLAAVMIHSWQCASNVNPRLFRASDLGDAFHAIYAPYVDIFRSDGFMADPIQQATIRYNTKVVGKLRDLPEAINAAINSRYLPTSTH
jgi:hypothetical protein